MSVWFAPPDLEALNRRGAGTLVEHLGICVVAVGEDSLSATMPVDGRTLQPYGILHGGASLALAETVGSMAGNLCVDPARRYVVGIEINANHLRTVRDGEVRATARPLHLGRRTQVWEIRIVDEAARLVCAARLTLGVLDRAVRDRADGRSPARGRAARFRRG